MPRGRKPSPTRLKIIAGMRSDRINTAEPKTAPGIPDCPRNLDAVAKREWKQLTAILATMRVLTKGDGRALAIYCREYSRWRNAQKDYEKHGVLVPCGETGDSFKKNPALDVLLQAELAMLRILCEFGLTPSSRSRINTGRAAGAPDDELGAFLDQPPKKKKAHG